MTWFAPGYVPEGWRRGDKLVITAIPSIGGRGSISRHFSALRLPFEDGSLRGGEIGYIVFLKQDIPEVEKWLAWWREG